MIGDRPVFWNQQRTATNLRDPVGDAACENVDPSSTENAFALLVRAWADDIVANGLPTQVTVSAASVGRLR